MSSRFAGRALCALALVSTAGLAEAAVSSNVALTSDYVFRGASQTNREPAIQGGFDVTTEGGAYFGTWGSSISWLSDLGGDISSNAEIDGYAGYRGSFSDSVAYDVGAIYYWYPGSYPAGFNDADTAEIYFGITAGIFGLKYSYAITDLFGYTDSDGSGYLDASVNWGFADTWTLNLHAGKQWIENNEDFEYVDWKIGATKAFDNGFSIAVAYTDTDAEESLYTNAFGEVTADESVFITLSRSF